MTNVIPIAKTESTEASDFLALFSFLACYRDYTCNLTRWSDRPSTAALHEAKHEALRVLRALGKGVFLADAFLAAVDGSDIILVQDGIPATDLIRRRK